MKNKTKPELCDVCCEKDELHWNRSEGWICDLCEEALEEDETLKRYEREASLRYMLDEADEDDYEE